MKAPIPMPAFLLQPSLSKRRHPGWCLPLALCLTLALAGCSTEPEAPERPERPERPAKTYETRGIVRQLPAAGTPGAELFIHHEAIPSFESIDGEVTGMDSMAMGFPVPEPGLIEGLNVGDKVAFSLLVDWNGSPPLLITDLQKLPADTVLSFDNTDDSQSDHSSHGTDPGNEDHGDSGSHDASSHDAGSHDAGHHEPADHGTDSVESTGESTGDSDQR